MKKRGMSPFTAGLVAIVVVVIGIVTIMVSEYILVFRVAFIFIFRVNTVHFTRFIVICCGERDNFKTTKVLT